MPGTAALNSGGNASLNSVSCGAAGECAAGGTYKDGVGTISAFVVSETNGVWGDAVEVPGTAALNSGGNASLNSVSCRAAGECAAGGAYKDGSSDSQAFVVSETSGVWGDAVEVPGTAALNSWRQRHPALGLVCRRRVRRGRLVRGRHRPLQAYVVGGTGGGTGGGRGGSGGAGLRRPAPRRQEAHRSEEGARRRSLPGREDQEGLLKGEEEGARRGSEPESREAPEAREQGRAHA